LKNLLEQPRDNCQLNAWGYRSRYTLLIYLNGGEEEAAELETEGEVRRISLLVRICIARVSPDGLKTMFGVKLEAQTVNHVFWPPVPIENRSIARFVLAVT
jgi:hypothetical protein